METGNRFLGVVHARDYRWKYKALLNRSHNIAISTFKKVTSSTSTRYYDFFGRRPACTSYGLGTEETLLNINMLADKKKDDYCGVFINEKSEERSVAVAVIILKKIVLKSQDQAQEWNSIKCYDKVNIILGSFGPLYAIRSLQPVFSFSLSSKAKFTLCHITSIYSITKNHGV